MLIPLPLYATPLCVDANATTDIPDGSCWKNPFKDLQSALDHVTQNPSVDQIWIASGVYKPSKTYAPLNQSGNPIIAGAISLPQYNPGITDSGELLNYADHIDEFNRKLITFN